MSIYLKLVGSLMSNHPAFSEEQEHAREITGIIASIIYSNDAITIVKLSFVQGHLKAVLSRQFIPDTPRIGEIWLFTGVDEAHPKYGEQFIVSEGFRAQPTDALIIKYIEYHAPGVGINKAKKLWSVFDQQIYRVLDDGDIGSLTDKKRGKLPLEVAILLVDRWHANKIETETVRFFQESGLPSLLAIKALPFYGKHTIQKIKDNPYRLLAFTHFQAIDKQAIECLGIEMHDPRRMNAAVAAAVYKDYDAGHTAIIKKDLIQSVKSFAQLNTQEAQQAINQALVDQTIVINAKHIYQGLGQASMEKFIARKIAHLLCNTTTGQQALSTPRLKPELLIEFEEKNKLFLNASQKQAVEAALAHRFAIIQGAKGVGKMICLLALHHQIKSNNGITQVALSGPAAKRMAKVTQKEASTIASFLTKVSIEPLPEYTKLVVYESSMVDVPTMIKLLRALPDTGSMTLIGDSRQLPPVGPGLIFHALSFVPDIPTVTLNQVHLSAVSSGISKAADLIRQKQRPSIVDFDKTASEDEQVGLCHISVNPQDISSTAVGLRHFIRKWGEVQVIAPTISLCDDINIRAHNSYRNDINGKAKPLIRCTKSIGLDDMIVCTSNLYYKGLTDGSLGQVTHVFESAVAKTLPNGEIELCYAIAEFEGQEVSLSASDFTKIKLGYCITCNKAQGSEFERVIIALPNSKILDNSWIYTAITRAKKQALIVGDIQTLYEHCIEPPKAFNRCIALPRMIQETLNGKIT